MSVSLLKLTFLWKFLEPILGDVIKERLKPKESPERAKELAFSLYRKLGEVEKESNAFVDALRVYAERTSYENKGQLMRAVQRLQSALPELADSIDDVNPQLEIHKHDIFQSIQKFVAYRDDRLSELEQSVEELHNSVLKHDTREGRRKYLYELLQSVGENHMLIKAAIDDMRTFLATEFSFKESF
jgi:vacuolar-type H+-ATPase subunit I/STV1